MTTQTAAEFRYAAGDRVLYKGSTPAVVEVHLSKSNVVIRFDDGRNLTVTTASLTPAPAKSVPDTDPAPGRDTTPSCPPADDVPAAPAPLPLSNTLERGPGGEVEPRLVNLDLFAVTGVCTVHGCQYDYIFPRTDWDGSGVMVELIYLSANTQMCPICRAAGVHYVDLDADTEPLAPVALPDDDSAPAPLPLSNTLERGQGGEVPDLAAPPLPPADDPPDAVSAELRFQRDENRFLRERIVQFEQQIARLHESVIALATKIPPTPSAHLDQADLDMLAFLCERHLAHPLEQVLSMLALPSVDVFAQNYAPFATACKRIAQGIAQGKIPVLLESCATDVNSRNELYLKCGFGFATVSVFNGGVQKLFEHTAWWPAISTWRSTDFTYSFDPPCRVLLGRDGAGYPRIQRIIEE